ncbi:MAG TPA: hypothetical protein VE268_12455, partial [Herpetosiphonaceae bacterium]|nr:hypothetical protein [Herpetosiphonaceae bacterium]
MSIAATAERVRTAYLDRLYVSAMLRDPHPRRAGEAVVAAWASVGREDARLDLHTEARLVASLPPLDLRRFARPERTRRLPGLPAKFWQLPPTTRLALGLWLLRRMTVPLIADALHLSPPQTQTILFDGLVSLTEELSNLPDESKCWLRARLDDSPAGRSHLLRCESCRSALGIWERAEDELATQLQAALGDISVPRSVAEAVRARLDVGQQRRTLAPWRSPLVLRLATVLAALIVLAALLYGFPAEAVSKPPLPATGPGAMIDGRVQAGSPRSFVEAARAAYLRVPETNGIVHRRWEISPVQAGPVWQADEWIDAQEPGRYRMQLLDGQQVKEWQTGDGTSALRYASTLAPLFCGPAPVGLDRHLGEINVWRMGAAEQTQMRVARWQAAPWSAGLYYLDVAARADSLRSLGLSGSGDAAVLTLAAEGRTFDGMLLLRLDPRTFDLREVRELRIDNGQTIAYVPWRLVQDETIDGMTARRQNLLAAYPDAQIPESIRREPGILDRTCPLIGREQALSLPRMLGLGLPGPIGLPAPPPGTDRAVLLGRPDSSASQVIYLGPGKRLALLFESAPTGRSRRLDVGTWHTPFVDKAQGVITSRIWEPQPETAPGHTGRPVWVLDLWAQGWSQDELAALIETVRRLRPDDWARRPDLFYDPQPLDAQTRAQVIPILSAAAPHAGRTLHRVMTATVRQPSFFASLPDPYHLPAGAWPATRRVESWVEVDEQGV